MKGDTKTKFWKAIRENIKNRERGIKKPEVGN
jgi:hypothetical protein